MPLYNEALGLAALHARIVAVARQRIKAKRGFAIEVVYVDDGSERRHPPRSPARLPAGPLDIQVVTLSRNFGKEAALLAGLDHARLGAVLFMDGDGQHPPELIETLVARWLDDGYDVVYTAKAHRENEPWLRRIGVHWFYALINWGQRQQDPRRRRRLPPAVAARGGGAAPDAGAQPLLQRPVELDRLPPGARRLRAGAARARRHHLECLEPDRLLDRGADLVLGRAAAGREPARPAARGAARCCSASEILVETFFFGKDVPGYPSLVVGMMVIGGVQLVMIGVLGEYIGKLLSEIKARPVYFVAEHSAEAPPGRAPPRRRQAARRARGRMSDAGGQRRIWLCADDYGISPGVNDGIRKLIARGRLNATSVMVVAPRSTREAAAALAALNAGDKRARIGLHVTLTAPFAPVSEGFAPLRDGAFPADRRDDAARRPRGG